MMTNMTGSSILKSTDHTSWVKPVNLSVRFILGDEEPYSDDFSDSEKSEGTSDLLKDQVEYYICTLYLHFIDTTMSIYMMLDVISTRYKLRMKMVYIQVLQ